MGWLRRTPKSAEDRFADEVSRLARSLLGAEVRRVDGFALEITPIGRDEPVVFYLQNVFRDTVALEGEDRATRLRTALLGLTTPRRPDTWDEAAPHLLPAVRSVGWAAASGTSDLVRRRLAPFVDLLVAIDSEHAMTFAGASDLAAWGVGEDEAMARAVANLSSQPLQVGRTRGVAFLIGPDGYTSSWLAVPSMIDRIAADVGGTVVAVAPDRDSLVLIDVDDTEAAVTALTQQVEEYGEATRQLSPLPYVVGDGVLEPWVPPAGHPAAPIVDRAAHLLAATEYHHQKVRLDELFEKAGEDVYVAPCTLMNGDAGGLWTWTSWVREVTDGLLPRTDYVFLADGEAAAPVPVRWDDVQRLAGTSLERTGYDPPRWRHHGWPDEATVATLRAVALDLSDLG